ncbi:MAG: hypothetical protein ABSG70_07105 [Terriglobales bacterium]|jgi:hypothetical protein
MRLLFLIASLLLAATTVAQAQKASDVADFVSIDAPVFVLDHVRVIDGTGAPAKEDQAAAITNGKIQSIGPDASAQIPPGARRMDRSGYTVIPGLVGMHNHLYYTDSYTVQVVGIHSREIAVWLLPTALATDGGPTLVTAVPEELRVRHIVRPPLPAIERLGGMVRARAQRLHVAAEKLDWKRPPAQTGDRLGGRGIACSVYDEDLRALGPAAIR